MCIDPFHLGEEMSDLSGGKVERGGRDDENSVWSQDNGEARDRAESIISYSLAMQGVLCIYRIASSDHSFYLMETSRCFWGKNAK